MILLFPSKGNLVEGQSIPLIQIPLSMIKNAQPIELNDFQWVAKTSDWESWIKANPRNWQAESEVYEDIDTFPHHSEIKRLKSFDAFYNYDSIFEEEVTGNPENADSMIRFIRSKNALLGQGKVDNSIEFENISPGEANAWFLSLQNEDGTDISESEMAYKIIRKYSSSGEFSIYSLEEIQPLNQKIDQNNTFEEIYEKTTDFLSQNGAAIAMALSGIVILKSIGGVYSLFSQYSRVRRFTRRAPQVNRYKGVLNFVKRGGKWAFKGLKGAAKLLQGVASGLGKGFKWGQQGYRFSRQTSKARPLAMSNAFKSFGRGFLKGAAKLAPKTAAEAIPVIGWILAIADVGQQTYNWFSSNQAPRYGDVDSFAKDVFEPGKIPAGEIITLCWTQEGKASSSWVGFLPLTSDDTRTTMNLAKVGDFNGSSLFILLNIGSKGLSQELMKNDINFIIFDSGAKFEHGILDNDDLKFRVASIDSAADAAQPMIFHGITPWETFMNEYNSASPDLVVVDPAAPGDFKFNFQNGDTRVNVTGELVSNSFVDLADQNSGLNKMIEKGTSGDVYYQGETPGVGETKPKTDTQSETEPETKSDSEREPANSEPDSTPTPTPASSESPVLMANAGEGGQKSVTDSESRVLKFGEFLMLHESASFPISEAEGEDGEDDGDDINLETMEVAIYKVTAIANADQNSGTNPPKFSHFIVGDRDQAYRAKTGDPIEVASDEVDLEDTRKGHAKVIERYKSEWLALDDVSQELEPVETSSSASYFTEPEEEKAQSYVEVDNDEVKIKYKEDKQKIKDLKADGFNLLKELTSDEEREALGISDWEEMDVIKLKGNPLEGDSRQIKLREKGAFGGLIPNGRKVSFTPEDGDLFSLALSIFNRMKNKVRVK